MIELQVTGMSCQHCVKAVTDALAAVAGVSAVETVDLESGRAVIQGSAMAEDLIAAVKQAGYEALVVG
jgi:copper chaperone